MIILNRLRTIQQGGLFDVDAEAFIIAVGTLTMDQSIAINDLVGGLKDNGTWASYDAIYPMIGGTAASHKWNLKNPLDTDAAYRLTFYGSWIHNADGAKGNGIDAWATTYYSDSNYSASGGNVDFTLAYYNNFAINLGKQTTVIGLEGNNDTDSSYLSLGDESIPSSAAFYTPNGHISWSIVNQPETVMYSITALNNDFKVYRNGNDISGINSQGVAGTPTGAYIAINSRGLTTTSDNSNTRSSYRCAFAAIASTGFTEAQSVADYNTIQAYQTALGRQN